MVAVKLMLKNINLDKEPPQIGLISLLCWVMRCVTMIFVWNNTRLSDWHGVAGK